MEYRIITEHQECLNYYKKFAIVECIWDYEELLTTQYDSKVNELYFIVLIEDGIEIGLVPLVFDKTEKKYYSYCGFHPENKKFLFDLKYFKEVFHLLPDKTRYIDINCKQVEEILSMFPEMEIHFKEKDKHYFLDLNKINHSFDVYLERFNSKHRKNLKTDIRKFKEKNYNYSWEKLENFTYVAKFNKERFGIDSDYSDEDFETTTKLMLQEIDKLSNIQTLVVRNEKEEIIGIEVAFIHNNIYYVLNGGYNRDYKNLGKVIMYEHIINAIKFNCDKVDFLVGDSGWKELWNLDYEFYYTLAKNN